MEQYLQVLYGVDAPWRPSVYGIFISHYNPTFVTQSALTLLTQRILTYKIAAMNIDAWCGTEFTMPVLHLRMFLNSYRAYIFSLKWYFSISITKGQVCTKQPRRLRPQCGPISHPPKPRTLNMTQSALTWSSPGSTKTSPPSWVALRLHVPLS